MHNYFFEFLLEATKRIKQNYIYFYIILEFIFKAGVENLTP